MSRGKKDQSNVNALLERKDQVDAHAWREKKPNKAARFWDGPAKDIVVTLGKEITGNRQWGGARTANADAGAPKDWRIKKN